jgi:hypothetical protein
MGSSGATRSFWTNFAQFELQSGVVCCDWADEGSLPARHLKVVPGGAWRKQILEGHHELQGHIGTTKMKLALRKSFYWFGMLADVDNWVKACKVCRRHLPGISRAPLIQEADSFFNQRVFTDLKGPLVEMRLGMVWYLVCIDGWSKWTELIPLPDAEATTVDSAFYNGWVCRHGMPVQLHSDQEANLVKSVGAGKIAVYGPSG